MSNSDSIDNKYDIILTASTYKSGHVAIDFLKSTKLLGDKVLTIFVAPREEDLTEIHSAVPEVPAIYIKSTINSLHFGRAWGFVWAVNNGVVGRYLCSCDDDIQFLSPADKIVERLDKADKEIGFSLMAFSSNHPAWAHGYSHITDCMSVGIQWVDGNCIFSKWEDNLAYGVIDATLGSPLLYYVELEYSHRMRFLTKKPIIFDKSSVFYHHVFRSDPELNQKRQEVGGSAVSEGGDFWFAKFGVHYDLSSGGTIHERIYDETTQDINLSNNYKKFVMFGGCWNNWADIYNRYLPGCKVIYDARS